MIFYISFRLPAIKVNKPTPNCFISLWYFNYNCWDLLLMLAAADTYSFLTIPQFPLNGFLLRSIFLNVIVRSAPSTCRFMELFLISLSNWWHFFKFTSSRQWSILNKPLSVFVTNFPKELQSSLKHDNLAMNGFSMHEPFR